MKNTVQVVVVLIAVTSDCFKGYVGMLEGVGIGYVVGELQKDNVNGTSLTLSSGRC